MKYILILISALVFVSSAQERCPSICPAVYMPICGFNGNCYRHFSNSCRMGVFNCNQNEKFRQVGYENCSQNSPNRC